MIFSLQTDQYTYKFEILFSMFEQALFFVVDGGSTTSRKDEDEIQDPIFITKSRLFDRRNNCGMLDTVNGYFRFMNW